MLDDAVDYQRARFHTRLPRDFRYTADHYWMRPLPGQTPRWQVGLTSYAIRLLGDLVEQEWAVQPGAEIVPGTKLGWLDGFKAATDLLAVVTGTFERGNAELHRHIDLLTTDCFGAGWLYEAHGQLDLPTLDVAGYGHLLNGLIDAAWARQERQGASYKDENCHEL